MSDLKRIYSFGVVCFCRFRRTQMYGVSFQCFCESSKRDHWHIAICVFFYLINLNRWCVRQEVVKVEKTPRVRTCVRVLAHERNSGSRENGTCLIFQSGHVLKGFITSWQFCKDKARTSEIKLWQLQTNSSVLCVPEALSNCKKTSTVLQRSFGSF